MDIDALIARLDDGDYSNISDTIAALRTLRAERDDAVLGRQYAEEREARAKDETRRQIAHAATASARADAALADVERLTRERDQDERAYNAALLAERARADANEKDAARLREALRRIAAVNDNGYVHCLVCDERWHAVDGERHAPNCLAAMRVVVTTCCRCGHQQKTVKPWAHIPRCGYCNKPMKGDA